MLEKSQRPQLKIQSLPSKIILIIIILYHIVWSVYAFLVPHQPSKPFISPIFQHPEVVDFTPFDDHFLRSVTITPTDSNFVNRCK